jgi:hypothetical protein
MGNILGFLGTLKGALIAASVIAVLSGFTGYKIKAWLVDVKEAHDLQNAVAEKTKGDKDTTNKIAVLESQLAALRSTNRTLTRTLDYEIQKSPNYRTCKPDAAFVRVLQEAVTGDTPR